jgi:hypothetical protein
MLENQASNFSPTPQDRCILVRPLAGRQEAEGMPAQPINDYVVGGVKKFLDALNSSAGTPMERLSPRDARQVLIDAQNRVTVGLSGIDTSERTIDFEGKDLK